MSINQDSPIFSWPQSLVEKSLRALQSDGVLALPVEDFYFTLTDVGPSLLDTAIQHMVKSMKTIAVGILGGPGSGKTPLARIMALCASRYWKRELQLTSPPSFREASEFDFFGGQPGRKDRPDIHDDGSLADEPIRKTKGFADVGCTMLFFSRERAMCRKRRRRFVLEGVLVRGKRWKRTRLVSTRRPSLLKVGCHRPKGILPKLGSYQAQPR